MFQIKVEGFRETYFGHVDFFFRWRRQKDMKVTSTFLDGIVQWNCFLYNLISLIILHIKVLR